MSEFVQPLDNQEIADHLLISGGQLQSYNPDLPNHVSEDKLMLHKTSLDWLRNQAEHSTEPLVTVNERDEHVLSAESLEADEDELKSWLAYDERLVKDAIKNPSVAREFIQTHYYGGDAEDDGSTPFMLRAEGDLSLAEVKTYLALVGESQESGDQRDNDLHMASLGVTAALVEHWAKRQSNNQLENGKTEDDLHILINLHEQPADENATTLQTHFTNERANFAGEFHELTRANVEKLGGAALSAEVIRGQIDNYYRSAPVRPTTEQLTERVRQLNIGFGSGPKPQEASTTAPGEDRDAEIARGQKTLRGVNIGLSTTTERPGSAQSEQVHGRESEKDRLAMVEEAARQGTLLGAEVEGETPAARQEWIARKLEEIRAYALSPATLARLRVEQDALLKPKGGYIEPVSGDRRYKQIRSILNINTINTPDPNEMIQIHENMAPFMSQKAAAGIPDTKQGIWQAYPNREAQGRPFFVTFNVDLDRENDRTFTYMGFY